MLRISRISRLVLGLIGCVVSAAVLATFCTVSLYFVYGGPVTAGQARLAASNLASALTTELTGTSNLEGDGSNSHGLLSLVADTVHLPLSDPLGMLSTDLLPTRLAPVPPVSPQPQAPDNPVTSVQQWQSTSQKLAIGWIPYTTASATIGRIEANPGMNVISPGWLMLWSSSGTVQDRTEPEVVTYAHAHHIKVWAMITNQFSGQLTHDTLSNPQSRQRLVASLARIAKEHHLDGLNMDFENVKAADQAVYTTFIGELHRALAPEHVTLSVDITPDIFFLQDVDAFFHAGLAANSDYVIVMAYDEHWQSDPTPGPVADVPWVSVAIDDLLNTGVPSDKLILGLPTYTYFWHVYQDGSVSGTPYATSSVLSILQSHSTSWRWLPDLGVGYARYPKPDGYEEVWFDTDQTMHQKLNLVNQLQLAGIAIWSLSFPAEHTWTTVAKALRQTLS